MQRGSLKPEGYVPRVSDRVLAELLEIFPAVEVAGTMWCGKTWMSLSFGESVTRAGRAAVRRAVEADPTIALVGERPHVIDEWQDVPAIWDAVRDAVDDGTDARFVAQSLARNIGAAVKNATVAGDAFNRDDQDRGAARKASEYIAALESLYVVESVAGWDAPVRAKSRLRTKPKRYFADPSLAASLLQVTPERIIDDGQLLGLLFESLCMHDLLVYASALPHASANPVKCYRDADGLEVDAIIELRDGRWAGIEIELGENKVDEAFSTLNRLREKVAANPSARNPRPAFMAVIVGAGEFARYDASADAYVIPLTALGA